MLFNSTHFVAFFSIVTILYFLLAHRYRWMLLLAASCYFYLSFIPAYLLILGFTIVVDYFAGIFIEKAVGKRRKRWLIISLVSNIGILAVFKYYNFISENIAGLFHLLGYKSHYHPLDIIIPLGLSFHTFQAMSYTIEVYRGKQAAERNFGIYAVYVMFYPQLAAGPIERPQNLLHQFYEKHRFAYDRVVEGLKLMLWGFVMKLVIADRLSIYVNAVYNNEPQHTGKSLALATVLFSFQIYCDFAGYSNIAIGAAKVMGFTLMTNFNRPYFSRSVSEFWKRWHISLSTWFKDYLYIPLGGNRVSVPRMYLNLLIVFMISGLWHGANWTFIVWGLLNGGYLVAGIATRRLRLKLEKAVNLKAWPAIHSLLGILLTFILVSFAWIFFRAGSMETSISIIKKIIAWEGELYLDKTQLTYGLAAVFFLLIVEFFQERRTYKKHLPFVTNHWFKEQLAYSLLLILILLLGFFHGEEFIYFQF